MLRASVGTWQEARARKIGDCCSSVAHFTKPHFGHLLWEYAEQHDFTDEETSEVWAWVESLPWDDEGIELYFDW